MCLYTNMICPQKAKKDIICYKVVKRIPRKTGHKKYVTPVQRLPVNLNSILSSLEPTVNRGRKHPGTRYGIPSYYVVEEGFIHCFTRLNNAIDWISLCSHFFDYRSQRPKNWAVILCIIPKGTLYYKSYRNDQICAKEIYTRGVLLKG